MKSLLTEKHDYRTLVIDPITTIYNDLLDKCERKVGTDFGRHYGAANKTMKRLANLIMALDMNVVITAHAKAGVRPEPVQDRLHLRRLEAARLLVRPGRRAGQEGQEAVRQGRQDAASSTFPDEDVFEWSYDAIKQRYDVTMLEKEAGQVKLATPEQVREIKDLLSLVRLPDGTVDKWFAKAGVDVWEDMPADVIAKCIEYVKGRLPSMTAA